MEIKGTAIKSIIEYVQDVHSDKFLDWFNSLSDEAKNVVNCVVTSGWYEMQHGVVETTQKIGALLFNNDFNKAAVESGRYSAELALHGIYKLYVKVSKPGHIIERASRILPAYYRPSYMETSERTPNTVKLIMSDFDEPSDIVEYRIIGWIEKALEISGCKGVNVEIIESMSKGSTKTVFLCSWN